MHILACGTLITTPEETKDFLISGCLITDLAAASTPSAAGRWFETNLYKILGGSSIITNPYNFRIDK